MIKISNEEFEEIIGKAIDDLPELYAKKMNNVAVVWEDQPTENQREKLRLRGNQTLFGLYEGIPLTSRGSNYNLVLPDKITIFKDPICDYAQSLEQLENQVGHTLWHEVAHHFGLNHDRIDELDQRNKTKKNQY